MNRKGDVFFLQEFVANLILAVVAVILFGLFLASAAQFKDRVQPSLEAADTALAARLGHELRTYLDAPHGNATFREALERAAADDACRRGLEDGAPPAGACAALADATAAFFAPLGERRLVAGTYALGAPIKESVAARQPLLGFTVTLEASR